MEAEFHFGADAPTLRDKTMAGKRMKRSSQERGRGDQSPRHGNLKRSGEKEI